MKDTTQATRTEGYYGTAAAPAAYIPFTNAVERFRAEAVAIADSMQTRDDLLNRIATLERELYLAQTRNAQSAHDYRYLLEMERHAATVFRERIAAILKAFYHAELSISSTQPIIALALELNPDLVERAR